MYDELVKSLWGVCPALAMLFAASCDTKRTTPSIADATVSASSSAPGQDVAVQLERRLDALVDGVASGAEGPPTIVTPFAAAKLVGKQLQLTNPQRKAALAGFVTDQGERVEASIVERQYAATGAAEGATTMCFRVAAAWSAASSSWRNLLFQRCDGAAGEIDVWKDQNEFSATKARPTPKGRRARIVNSGVIFNSTGSAVRCVDDWPSPALKAGASRDFYAREGTEGVVVATLPLSKACSRNGGDVAILKVGSDYAVIATRGIEYLDGD